MKFYQNWLFWTVLVGALGGVFTGLTGVLPTVVIKVALVLLAGATYFISNYQTREAYSDGKSGVVGSKYQP